MLIFASSDSAGGSAGIANFGCSPKAAAVGLATGVVGFGIGGPSVRAAVAGPSVRAAGAGASVGAVAVDGPGASAGFDPAPFSEGVVGGASGLLVRESPEEVVLIWHCS